MKFCPRCGSLMIPVKRERDYIILRCPRCGYEEKVKLIEGEYTLVNKPPQEERVITTLKVSKASKKSFRSREEWEQEREEYREVLQELLQEELEGSEE
ncbi:MAG: RNA polymerase [Pyrodictiaceae archaeon]